MALGLLCVGGSAYRFLGGGAQACITPEGFSACGEFGLGYGGGADVSPFGNLAEDFRGLEVGGKVAFGPLLGLSLGSQLSIDPCTDIKNTVGVMLLGFDLNLAGDPGLDAISVNSLSEDDQGAIRKLLGSKNQWDKISAAYNLKYVGKKCARF